MSVDRDRRRGFRPGCGGCGAGCASVLIVLVKQAGAPIIDLHLVAR